MNEWWVGLPLKVVLTRRVSLGALLRPADLIFAWNSSILSGIGGGRRTGLGRHGGRLFCVSWCNDETCLHEVLELFHTRGDYPVTNVCVCETM